MVIRKMNNVFEKHGKFLIGLLTLFIVATFVVFFTPGANSLLSDRFSDPKSVVGTAFEEDITMDAYRERIDNSVLYLKYSYPFPISTEKLREYALRSAFTELCSLKAAEKCGVVVTDNEVRENIEKSPRFQTKGKFDIAKYNDFVEKQLKPTFSAEDFCEAVRQNLALEKLHKLITEGVVVTQNELRDYFNNTYEKFDVWAVTLKAKDYRSKVKVDKKDIKAFYDMKNLAYKTAKMKLDEAKAKEKSAEEKDALAEAKKAVNDATMAFYRAQTEAFLMPPEFKIMVVRFDYSKFTKEAQLAVKDADIEKYYNTHKYEFKEKDAKFKALAKVKTNIRLKLVQEKAKALAFNKAKVFSIDAYNALSELKVGADKVFLEEAKKAGLKVSSSGLFFADAVTIPGIGSEAGLVRTVAAHYRDTPVTDAVAGNKAAFVAFVLEKKEVREATLEESSKKITEQLKTAKAAKEAYEKARKLALQMNDSKKVMGYLKSLKKTSNAEKLDTFQLIAPPKGINGAAFAKLSKNTLQGSISAVEKIDGFGSVFVFVEKRTLPTDEDFNKSKAELEKGYRSLKERVATDSFSNWVNKNSKMFSDQ